MKTFKKIFVYFIALIIALIYGNIAHSVGMGVASWMSGIAMGIVTFGVGYYITTIWK